MEADYSSTSDDSVSNENETSSHPIKRKKPTQHQEYVRKLKKLQRKKLVEKMNGILGEYAIIVGEQVSLIYADSIKKRFRSYGTQPLIGVINRSKDALLKCLGEDLDKSSSSKEYQTYLPPLELNGRRVDIEDATQGMLRTLLPRLLKISSGSGRPGWGIPEKQPSWWPICVLPWSNVRIDRRGEEQKSLMSWTEAMRIAVINCYVFHNRLDLLRVDGKTSDLQTDKSDPLIGGSTTEKFFREHPRFVLSFTENSQLRPRPDAKIVEDEEGTKAINVNVGMKHP